MKYNYKLLYIQFSTIFSPSSPGGDTYTCTYTVESGAILDAGGSYTCSADIDGEVEESDDFDLIVYCKFRLPVCYIVVVCS